MNHGTVWRSRSWSGQEAVTSGLVIAGVIGSLFDYLVHLIR